MPFEATFFTQVSPILKSNSDLHKIIVAAQTFSCLGFYSVIMAKTEASLPSPPSESAAPVSLDSSVRSTPIHPDLTEIQVPGDSLPSYRYHPITCLPIDDEDVRTQLELLRREFPSKETALRAQEQAAKEAKRKIEESEKKREQVQKAIDKKIKERDTELKVLSKYQEVKASDIPS